MGVFSRIRNQRKADSRRPNRRLVLETMEDRTVPAAFEAVLQLTGGTGDLQPITIPLENYRFGFESEVTIGSGRITTDRPKFDALQVQASLNSASVGAANTLWTALTSRGRYNTGILTQTGANGTPVAAWALGSVYVSDYVLSLPGDVPIADVKFSFLSVTEATSAYSASWDVTRKVAQGPALPAGLVLDTLPTPPSTGLTLELSGGTANQLTAPILLRDYSFGFAAPSSVTLAGVGVGRPNFTDLTVTANYGASSPLLFDNLTPRRAFDQATLVQRDSAGRPVAAWVLGTVVVAKDAILGNRDELPQQELKITFGSITAATVRPSTSVKPAEVQTASWNRLANTPTGPALPNNLTLHALPAAPPTTAYMCLFEPTSPNLTFQEIYDRGSTRLIPIESYNFGLHQTLSFGQGGNQVRFEPLEVRMRYNTNSPGLIGSLTRGSHYPMVSLIQFDESNQRVVARWNLGTAFVTDSFIAGDPSEPPAQNLKIVFGSALQNVVVNGQNVVNAWSQVKNSPNSSDIPLNFGSLPAELVVANSNGGSSRPYGNQTGGTSVFPYDGTARAAVALASGLDGTELPGTYSFSYYPGTVITGPGSATPPVDAGTYSVVAKFTSADPSYGDVTSDPLSFTIAPAVLTVSPAGNAKTYGQAVTQTGTLSGLVDGDDITATFSSAGDAATAPVGRGVYPITSTLADPNNRLRNYKVVKTNASLTVAKASLTVTADDQTRAMGLANPPLTVQYNGFVNGEDATDLRGRARVTTLARPASIPGTYDLRPYGLSSTNYAITFTKGILTVTPAPLVATPVNFTAKAGVSFDSRVATFLTKTVLGGAGSYEAVIDWGDGTTTVGRVRGTGTTLSVFGNHTYAGPGTQTVTVTISHKKGFTQSATVTDLATIEL